MDDTGTHSRENGGMPGTGQEPTGSDDPDRQVPSGREPDGWSNGKKLVVAGLAAGAAVGAGVVAYVAWRKLAGRYGFFADQSIGASDVPVSALRQFSECERELEEGLRLARARVHIDRDGQHDCDIAGFLVFSTLEIFLRRMADAVRPGLLEERERGLLAIGRKLRSIGALERGEYEEIRTFATEVRNPLIHGSVYEHTSVWDALLFCESFIARHASDVFDRTR